MKLSTLMGSGGVGLIGAAAGLAVSLCGSPASAQSAGGNATAPANPAVRSFSAGAETSNWFFKSGPDSFRINSNDGKVVRAERNGQEIPADRVTMKDGRITVLDENGKVAVEFGAPVTTFRAWSGQSGNAASLLGGTRRGPLISTYGQTLGPGSGGSWIGFADAADNLEPPTPPKVMMGITMAEPEYGLRKHCGLDQRPGTMVNEAYKNLPAAKAGIEPFDVIVEIDGKSPATPDVVRSVLQSKDVGDQVHMRVLHKCEPKDLTVTLEAYSAEKLEQAREEQMKAAGIEPPSLDEQPLDAAENLRSLIARVQPGAAGTNGADGLLFVNPSIDDNLLSLKISEAIKRLHSEGEAGAPRGLTDERAKKVEDRLDRLERLLEKLVDQQEKPAPAAAPAPPPAPAVPPKGGA